ncbi:MAG: SRPBCC family protein [Polyangiales bacterium]
MRSWKSSIQIDAPADRVFAYVDDPKAMPEWFPSLVEVHNVIGAGEGQQEEWTYKLAGILLRGEATVVEHVPNQRAVHQTIGMGHGTVGYSVERHDEGTTLTLEIEYEIPIPVLGRMAERLTIQRNAREFELALINVREALEA